jgi:S-formylglutathione hydrolase FrmB
MAILQGNFYSNSLKGQTQVLILLPAEKVEAPGFPPQAPEKPLKTLYLLHGYSGNHMDWLVNGGAAEVALQNNLAVVCPTGGNSCNIDDEALGALHEQWVCHELPGLLERMLPLSRLREDRFIGGLSMGGYGALRLGLKHAGQYAAVVALSSALIDREVSQLEEGVGTDMAPYAYYRHVFGEPKALAGSDRDLRALAAKLGGSGTPFPELYLACGEEDFLINQNRDFEKFLTESDVPHVYREGPGAHDWNYWRLHLHQAAQWLKEKGML